MAWIASISPVDKTTILLRKILYFLFALQMVMVIERLVFDFLGYMWLMIAMNFIDFAFLIFGIYGVEQLKLKYMFAYLIWTIVWLIFNLLVVLLYSNAMSLTHEDDWLSLKQGQQSWFKDHGVGCKASAEVPQSGKSSIQGCVVRFEHVEIIQATIQLILGASTFGIASWFLRRYREYEEDEFGFIGGFDPYSAYIHPSKSSKVITTPRYV